MDNVNRKSSILVTLDSTKNRNTGLFYFATSLGRKLFELNKENYHFDLSFYLHKQSPDIFGQQARLLTHSKLHNYYFPKKGQFHLVHFSDQICRLPPSKVKAKRILTIHDLNQVHEGTVNRKFEKKIARLSRFIDQCNIVVAISDFVAADIATYLPNVGKKLRVIRNGADDLTDLVTEQPSDSPSRPFIFTIGEILAKKNFHVLPSLLEGNDFELLIAGKPNNTKYEERIMAEAIKLSCEHRVKLLGPISENDKAWYYGNCLAFAFPSLAEGFGLPVIEAMHFGKPVFLSERTSLPEVGGDVAFYFKTFEKADMQKVFYSGLEYYQLHDQLKDQIKERARQFTWEKSAKEYLDLYKELLDPASS